MPAPPRKSRERGVQPAFQLDRIAVARRFAACLSADRTNMHAVALHTGIPVKQLRNVAERRRVMDWAYHACAMWCAQVESRVLRAERNVAREARAALRARSTTP